MDEPDMSGVDPLRWDEVRRRIAVIRDYLAIPHPTVADRRAHATRLDRSVNQFMALVRAWREHGSAARIAAAGTHRRAPRRPSRLSVDPAAKEIAAEAISELGAGATVAEVSRIVGERCAAKGVTPPSDSTLWNSVRAARRERGSGETGVVIGTCMVPLPVATKDGLAQPMLTIAVRAADKTVLAASLATADWATAAIAIAAAMDGGGPVRADRDLIGSGRAVAIRAGVEPIAVPSARSALSRILGTGIDGLRLVYRPSRAVAAERLLTTGEDRPLSTSDARAVVIAAVARHNAARGARDASWIDSVSPSQPS